MTTKEKLEKVRDEFAKSTADFCDREQRLVGEGKPLDGLQAYEWECQLAIKDGANLFLESLSGLMDKTDTFLEMRSAKSVTELAVELTRIKERHGLT